MTAVSEPLPQTVEETPPPQPKPWCQCVVAAGVPTVLTGLHATYYGQWIVDDAGLTFAYVRSLATGAGPVLQPGADPVEGYSNPAWVAVLVVGRWLGMFDHGTWFGTSDIVLFPKLVALLCCFGIFAAMFAIAIKVTSRPVFVTVIAGSAASAVPSFVIWTTSGLENALFALAVVAIAAVLARAALDGRLLVYNTAIAVGALAAVAALTRPEGIIYAAAFPVATALAIRSHSLRRALLSSLVSLAAFAFPTLSYLLWRLMTFGDYLPNTARAKEQGLPSIADLSKIGDLAGYVGWLAVCLGVAAVAVTLSRRSPVRTAVAMVLIPLGLAIASFAILQPDWMSQFRFATPVWPLAATAVTLSVVHLLRDSSRQQRTTAAMLTAIVAVFSGHGFSVAEKEFRAQPTVGVCNIAQNTGYLFNGYADILGIRDGTLLAVDGGGTALTSRLRYVDLSGLAERRIAGYWQDDDMGGLRDYVLEEVRPTFVKVFWGWSETDRLALTNDPRFTQDYLLMFAGQRGAGEWVRRDAIPDRSTLKTARQWGGDTWNLINDRYRRVVPPIWWCGETLRPTPFHTGSPSASPITEP